MNKQYIKCIKDVFMKRTHEVIAYEGDEFVYNNGYINSRCGEYHNISKPGHEFFDKYFILMINEDEFAEEFLDKTNRVAVHCRTEEEANKFCQWMHKQCLKWHDGGSYITENEFLTCKDQTCYTNRGFYADSCFYKREGYKIIEFSAIKFNKMEKKGEEMKKYEDRYEVVGPFCFKNILDKTPCKEEKEKAELELFRAGHVKIDWFSEWEDIKDFDCVKRNIDWLVEKGFIRKIKQEFKPFTLELPVNSREELESLWCRLNMCIRSGKNGEECGYPYKCESRVSAMFKIVHEKLEELENN